MPVGHPKQKNLIFTDEILLLIDWCFPKTNKYYFNYAHTLIFVRRYVSLKKSSFINSFIGVNQGNEIENATNYLVCCLTFANIFECDEAYLRTQISKMVKGCVDVLTQEYLTDAF